MILITFYVLITMLSVIHYVDDVEKDPNVCYLFLSNAVVLVVVCGYFTFIKQILDMFVVLLQA